MTSDSCALVQRYEHLARKVPDAGPFRRSFSGARTFSPTFKDTANLKCNQAAVSPRVEGSFPHCVGDPYAFTGRLAAEWGAFIDQSRSLDLFVAAPTIERSVSGYQVVVAGAVAFDEDF